LEIKVLLLLLFAVGNAKPTKIKEVSSVNTAHLVSQLQRQNAGETKCWSGINLVYVDDQCSVLHAYSDAQHGGTAQSF